MKKHAIITAVLVLFFAPAAHAEDPIPFFKPDPKPPAVATPYGPPRPHSVATECAYNDPGCLRAHDERVIDWAVGVRDKGVCTYAVRVNACMVLYEFIYDDGDDAKPAPSNNLLLLDPCTFVVRTDNGYTTLYSFRTKRWLRVRDEGWTPAEFLGACVVGELPALPEHGVQTLPGFPWTTAHARRP